MIDFFDVSDTLEVFGQHRRLLSHVNFRIPPGRYALMSQTPEYHKPLIDLIAAIRPPTHGSVVLSGTISWPLGRVGFVRGRASGRDLIDLVCTVHDLSADDAAEIVTLLVSRPEFIEKPIEKWPQYLKQEFTYALGLVPNFDIYVIDGPIPFEPCRFTRLWLALFEERLAGKTLILSTYRQRQALEYCGHALIYEEGGFRIDADLEACVERYPARPAREDAGENLFSGDANAGEFSF